MPEEKKTDRWLLTKLIPICGFIDNLHKILLFSLWKTYERLIGNANEIAIHTYTSMAKCLLKINGSPLISV